MIQRLVKISVIHSQEYNINNFLVVSIMIYKREMYSEFRSVLDCCLLVFICAS